MLATSQLHAYLYRYSTYTPTHTARSRAPCPQGDDDRQFRPVAPAFADGDDAPKNAHLVLHQERVEGQDRLAIPNREILSSLVAEFHELEMDYKKMAGMVPHSRYGDWLVFGPPELCEKFIEANPDLQLAYEDDDGVHQQVTLSVRLVKPKDLPVKNMNLTDRAVMDTMTVHAKLRVPDTFFDSITFRAVTEGFEDYGLMVHSISRPGVVVDGKSLRGKQYRGNTFHLRVAPREGRIIGGYYPPTVKVRVGASSFTSGYELADQPELEGLLCMKVCHRYFASAYQTLTNIHGSEWCKCEQFARGAKPSEERAKCKAVEDSMLLRVEQIRMDKGKLPCKFFSEGKCARTNKKCKFMHDGDPGLIPCALPQGSNGKCKVNGCLYIHFDPATSSMNTECMLPHDRPP